MRAFYKLHRPQGLEAYLQWATGKDNDVRYSHSAKNLPTTVVYHSNWAKQAEEKMKKLAGRSGLVHLSSAVVQSNSNKVAYNMHGEQVTEKKNHNSNTLSQIFGAMEQVHPFLKEIKEK